jgi:hypothetical protein
MSKMMTEAAPNEVNADQKHVWHFTPGATLPGCVRLECRVACGLDGVVVAIVNGVVLGEIKIERTFYTNEYFYLPIRYFPYIELPATVHFMLDAEEIARPLVINSAEDVMAMIGPGEITVEDLHLDGGLLRGNIINLTNGVFMPLAYVKLNGLIVRSAILEPARLRNVGGTSAKFAVPIRPTDFLNEGLLVEVHLAGVDHALASFSYRRDTLSGERERLIKLSEKLRQLEKSSVLHVELLKAAVDQRLNLQQERLDAFIEYAMALILDNIAGPGGRSDPAAFSSAVKQLRAIDNRVESRNSPVVKPASIAVPLDSSGFAVGWYDLESNDAGYFRWMSQNGLVRNPDVSRPIADVQITVSQVYASPAPTIRAFLDDQELSASTRREGGVFVLTLKPPPGAIARGESLMLESFAVGCPATDEGTSDNRLLSISAAHVLFRYDQRA